MAQPWSGPPRRVRECGEQSEFSIGEVYWLPVHGSLQAPDLTEAMVTNAQPSPSDPAMLRDFALVGLNRSILWASDSFTQVLGWQPRHMQGRAIYELMHPDDRTNTMAVRGELDY